MQKKEDRLKNLDNEEFYLILFDGTLMPKSPRYTKLTMFNDIFYIDDENVSNQYIEIECIIKIQQFLTKNLDMLDKIINTKEYVKSSFHHKILFKINDKEYCIDKNSCDEEGKKIYEYFNQEIFKIIRKNNSKNDEK